MPKKKKTLKQKMLADTRRERETQFLYSLQPVINNPLEVKPQRIEKPSNAISTIKYDYLVTDLRKTAFFTGLVILVELALNYFL